MFLFSLISLFTIFFLLLDTPFPSQGLSYFKITQKYLIRLMQNNHDQNDTICHKMPMILFQPNRAYLTEGLYITAWPNPGAGIGHQFDEWVQGISAAYKFNITYVHTPFLINSAHWNSFLCFGANEMVEDDIRIRHKMLNVWELRNNPNSISPKNWILQHINHHSKDGALFLRLYQIPNWLPRESSACFDPINIRLRMKYCAARVIQPVRTNLYRDDFIANRFIVAVHLRCGDSCYDSWRATPLPSIENTILKLHSGISQYYHKREVVFHLFSEPPMNNTAKKHFHLLLHSIKFQSVKPFPVKIVPHFSLNAPITLHHLITADILLTAQSGFSNLAAVLRTGITFGPVQSCNSNLTILEYDKTTGNFSLERLKSTLDYKESTQRKQNKSIQFHFQSMEECYLYKKNESI